MDSLWKLVTLSSPYRGQWRYLELACQGGGTCVFRLHLSKKQRWRWEWEERWLGKTTVLSSKIAFRRRQECMDHLRFSLTELGWGELADGVMEFEWPREEDDE